MNEIFETFQLNGITLNNRILRSATYEGMADTDGKPLPELIDLYERLAKGGAGAIVTSMAGVSPSGRAMPDMLMIDRDDHLESFKEMTAAVHSRNTPIFMQLTHAGRQTKKQITGRQPMAPSSLRDPAFPLDKPREMTETDIQATIEDFATAIERAQQVGFDGVQLHLGHGWLMSQFLSAHTNKRKDRWGGTPENRFRIVGKIFQAARKRLGDYPIWVKLNAYDGRKNGMCPTEAAGIAKRLEAEGCAAIEVSCGVMADGFSTIRMKTLPTEAMLTLVPELRDKSAVIKMLAAATLPRLIKTPRPVENYNAAAAERIKQSVSIPVFVVGGVRTRHDIQMIIETRQADAVSLSRPFIIEPDIVNRLKSGKQDASKCLSCGYCAVGVTSSPLRCYYGGRKPVQP